MDRGNRPLQDIIADLDEYLATRKQQAESGQIAYGWWSVARYHLEKFRPIAGEMAIKT